MILLFTVLISVIVYAAPQPTSDITTLSSGCNELGDCLLECSNKCGCDRSVVAYYYNETLNECVVDMKHLMLAMIEKYNSEEKIRNDAEKVFKGILISAVFVIGCALTCALTACIYCCHVNYSDYKLNSDVDALVQKVGRDKLRKTVKKPNRAEQASQSCNVIVEDAGVFVC